MTEPPDHVQLSLEETLAVLSAMEDARDLFMRLIEPLDGRRTALFQGGAQPVGPGHFFGDREPAGAEARSSPWSRLRSPNRWR